MHYRRLTVMFALLGAVALPACRREAPPPPPPPPVEQEEDDDAERLARERAEQLRLEEEARAAEELERRRAEARSTLEARVHFDYDESRIRPDAEATLRQKVAVLQASPAVRLRLEGHTDERGSGEYNQALGSRRAQAVYDFLQQHGLSADRFETTSFGEERPLVNRSDEQAWAQNRRVEFIIIAGADQINPPSDQ